MRHKTMAAFGAPDKAGEQPSVPRSVVSNASRRQHPLNKGKILRRYQRVTDLNPVILSDVPFIAQRVLDVIISAHYSELGNEHLLDVVNASCGDVIFKHSPRNVCRFLVNAKAALDGL